MFPQKLHQRLKEIYSPSDLAHVLEAFALSQRNTSFRINSESSQSESVLEELDSAWINARKLEWMDHAYICDRYVSRKELEAFNCYQSGAIYVQWVASQIPALCFTLTDPKYILDACAAPGWKTSQLSARYPRATIYAFEPSKVRYEKLLYTLKKQWSKNVTAIHACIEDIENHLNAGITFDGILVDAPCSSEWGILTKSEKFLSSWSEEHIRKNYKRQKKIVSAVIPHLANNWELIYSTCTLAPEENEAVAHFVICWYSNLCIQALPEHIFKSFATSEALSKFGQHIYSRDVTNHSMRINPSETSEWFYVVKFIKKDS